MKNKRIFSKDINKDLLYKDVTIFGWIHKKTKIGNFIFLTLRDGCGFCQLVIDKNNPSLLSQTSNLTKETVISVSGQVKSKQQNNKQNTDAFFYEIFVNKLFIINRSSTLPFMIQNDTDGLEKIRLKHRYLDLRRPIMQKNMWTRHHFFQEIRNFFHTNGNFIEIDTPILSALTTEGARNFLVISNAKKNHYFALPQSPQIYKQIIMNSGFPGYFQLARCFRDEDLRNNRQPEFTQLDLEINFANADEVMFNVEKLIIHLWKKFKSIAVNSSFFKINYFTAWNKYGSDKPDLRYELFLEDYHTLMEKNESVSTEKVMKGISFNNKLSDENWKKLQIEIEKITKQSLFFVFDINEVSRSNLTSNQLKILKPIMITKKRVNWIGFSGNLKDVNLILGKVRVLLADYFQLTANQSDHFCWVINQPMFEFSKIEQKYVSVHHPFCQPRDLNLFNNNWKQSEADAYDLVINGEEMGSGSVRIHDVNIQKKVFRILGFEEQKTNDEFGFFLQAMQYGFPNHAGFALGLERLIVIFTNSKSIRDVIAFPKTTKGTCLLTQTPKKILKI